LEHALTFGMIFETVRGGDYNKSNIDTIVFTVFATVFALAFMNNSQRRSDTSLYAALGLKLLYRIYFRKKCAVLRDPVCWIQYGARSDKHRMQTFSSLNYCTDPQLTGKWLVLGFSKLLITNLVNISKFKIVKSISNQRTKL